MKKKLFLIVFIFMLFYAPKVNAMQIFVELPSTEKMTLDVESTDEISVVKEKIYEKNNNYFVTEQILMFNNKIMDDFRSLADYDVKKEDTIYLDIKKYKVIFDANGGTFTNQDQYIIEKWNNSDYDNLVKPTKDGYNFKGYFTEKTGGTQFELILNESGIDADMIFYAQWEEKEVILEPEIENPKTFDSFGSNMLLCFISLILLTSMIVYLKRSNKINY